MVMIRPPYLKAGDTIGIVAPAGSFAENEIEAAVEIIRSWDLTIKYGKNLFKNRNSFAGSDKQRAEDMQNMFDDPSINAILCARGGYGTIRIMEMLRFEEFLNHPRFIIGYSDITVLHSALQKCFSVESIHGPMVRFVPPKAPDLVSFDSLRAMLFGEINEYRLAGHALNLAGEAKGVLTGGNLSVLYSIAGSRYEVDTRGKILFIEDLNEPLYHIDRMMMNMKVRGRLKHLKALIVGAMNDMKGSKPGFHKPAYDIINDMVAEYGYPVMFGFPAGHEQPNLPLILGREVKVKISKESCRVKFGR